MHFLQNIFSPQTFTSDQLDTIISKFTAVSFVKDSFLLKEGSVSNTYWFIEKGYARSYVNDTEGRDISTNFYTTGDITIDWSSFFMRQPTRENIQALTDCSCWQVNFDDFQALFHSIEAFREQGRRNLVSSYFALKNRNISMIADPAKARYKRLLEEKPEIVQNVSLKQIATYLGITDTSLSRIRKELASE